MSEYNPEQPGLPIFEGQTVRYTVVHDRTTDTVEGGSEWQTVHIPVDEIDSLSDPKLAEALWRQFAEEEKGSQFASLTFVRPDGSYNRTIHVPIGRRYMMTTDADIEEEYQHSREIEDRRKNLAKLLAKLKPW